MSESIDANENRRRDDASWPIRIAFILIVGGILWLFVGHVGRGAFQRIDSAVTQRAINRLAFGNVPKTPADLGLDFETKIPPVVQHAREQLLAVCTFVDHAPKDSVKELIDSYMAQSTPDNITIRRTNALGRTETTTEIRTDRGGIRVREVISESDPDVLREIDTFGASGTPGLRLRTIGPREVREMPPVQVLSCPRPYADAGYEPPADASLVAQRNPELAEGERVAREGGVFQPSRPSEIKVMGDLNGSPYRAIFDLRGNITSLDLYAQKAYLIFDSRQQPYHYRLTLRSRKSDARLSFEDRDGDGYLEHQTNEIDEPDTDATVRTTTTRTYARKDDGSWTHEESVERFRIPWVQY